MEDTKEEKANEFIRRFGEIAKKDISDAERFEEWDRLAREFNRTITISDKDKREIIVLPREVTIEKLRSIPEGPVYLPAEAMKFDQDVFSLESFRGFLAEEGFDEEVKKDMIIYKRIKDGYLEEYRFDKTAIIDEEGRESRPSLKGMQKDFRETMTLAILKKQNPVVWYPIEAFKVSGHDKGKIPGWLYRRKKQDHAHLASLSYRKYKILPDGELDPRVIQGSPYFRVEFPDKKGEPTKTWIHPLFVEAINFKTGELKAGKFKELPQRNPYSLRSTKGKAYEWLIKNVKGRNLTITTRTILKEKLGLSTQYLQRKEYCLEKICDWLEVAKGEGYEFKINAQSSGNPNFVNMLQKYPLSKIKETLLGDSKDQKKLHSPDRLGDCRSWIIEFFSPLELKYTFTEEDEILADEIIEYLYHKNDFGLRNPEEKTRGYLLGYIKRLGHKQVKDVYLDIKMSPSLFEEINGKRLNQATQLFLRLKDLTRKPNKKKQKAQPRE